MITVKDALKIVYKESWPIAAENKDILSALNMVLAEDIYSKDNLPPFDKSAMDGYAIRSIDTEKCSKDTPKEFIVKGVIKAGEYCEESINYNEAFKIMTGAPIPKGADCVIEIEKVKTKEDKVYIYNEVKKNNHIINLGEEIKIGEIALSKGKKIRPAEIGILASLGYNFVKVYRKPLIGLIITGDELVDIDDILEKGKIRNSNEYVLKAMIKNLGAEVLSFGIVRDDKEILKNVIIEVLDKTDLVITSGGASAGDYDFVERVLNEIGADVKFNSVAIKPGKPISFATYKGKLFFSLPGNPLSAITTFEQFIDPVCRKIMGDSMYGKEEILVIAADNFKFKQGRVKYIYVNIIKKDNNYYGHKIGSQGSNRLTTISKANGVIIIPENVVEVKVGEVLSGRFIFKE